MTLKSALLVGTSISLAASGAAFAGGVAPAAEPMVMMAPVEDPTDIGYLELSFGSMSLDDSLDGDFDESHLIHALEGQAFARIGSFVLELQGYTHDDTDDNDDQELVASVGAFGHYLFDFGGGTAGVFAGTTSGALVEHDEGVGYGVVGVGYSGGPWYVTVGAAAVIFGDQDGDDGGVLEGFHYISGGYDYEINEMWTVGIEGMVGHGSNDNNDDAHFHELSLSAAYDMTDRVRLSGSVGAFGMTVENGGDDDKAAGHTFALGLSIALGGSNRDARDAIPFDTPNLHRPVTWMDAIED